MKKSLCFTFVVFFHFMTFAQPGWEVYHSGYLEESRGISAFGILNSTTKDVAWSIAYDGSGNNDEISAIAYTADGGVTWTVYDPVSFPEVINLGISMVYPTSANTAYLTGYKRSFGNGGVFKTTNAGATWTRSTASNMFANTASFCNVVYFWNSNTGFVQGDPVNGEFEMYRTTDGGNTWIPISGANIDNPLPGEYGVEHGVVFTPTGSSVWFKTNKGRLFRSTDQGQTWKALPTFVTDFDSAIDKFSVTFKNDNEGWIIRSNSELYHSTNGGAAWTQMLPNYDWIGADTTNPNPFFGGDISFIPGSDNTLVITESNTNLPVYGAAISYDGGQNWHKMIYYNFEGGPWEILTPSDNIQHISLGFRDDFFGLSGGLSHLNNPNDPNSAPTQGVFKYNIDTPFVAGETIAGLSVYPNPASTFVKVNTDGAALKNIAVYDIAGKEVLSFNNLSVNNMTINTSDLEKGTYLIKIEDANNNHQVVKVVIK